MNRYFLDMVPRDSIYSLQNHYKIYSYKEKKNTEEKKNKETPYTSRISTVLQIQKQRERARAQSALGSRDTASEAGVRILLYKQAQQHSPFQGHGEG